MDYERLAPLYDLGLRLMSFGTDRRLRSAVADSVPNSTPILDVCTGTGAVALDLARKQPNSEIVGLDISQGMLQQAKKRALRLGLENVEFVLGEAQGLPYEDRTFASVTCSLGVHEITSTVRARAIAEMVRVLKNDGVMVVLDFNRPANSLVRSFIYRPLIFLFEEAEVKEFAASAWEKEFEKQGLLVTAEPLYFFLKVMQGQKREV